MITLRTRLGDHVARVYPWLEPGERIEIVRRLVAAVGLEGSEVLPTSPRLPGSDEIVLITYADTLTEPGTPGLATLARFVEGWLDDLVTTVHLLPFWESSSDGGFSVVDYRRIADGLGDWSDVVALGARRAVMVDLVCNHGSVHSERFAEFIADLEPGRRFYKTAAPTDDLRLVVRPRTHPLLVPVDTRAGTRHVWATFSPDQVDFDYANPDVLVEFCEILGFYLDRGASRIRLDAIAYLWKELGTTCIHLPQTHEIVKVIRALVSTRDPTSLLITETNVAHRDNVSYLGEGDEANVVYNFTLAPLIVWSLVAGSAALLTEWLGELAPLPTGCTFLNFLATHDGIGLRPVEDRLSDDQLALLLDAAVRSGGAWSAYSSPAGPRPYELNVSLADLLAGTDGSMAGRFVVAHAIMLSLQGIPALYVHSLLVTPGDHDAVARTGHKRDINRSRVDFAAASALIGHGWRGAVFDSLSRLISVRRSCSAFDPAATQRVLDIDHRVVAVERVAPVPGTERVLALHNVSPEPVTVDLRERNGWFDLIRARRPAAPGSPLVLEPWQAYWLTPRSESE